MTPRDRQKRWEQIDRELEEIWAGKVGPDVDPAQREEDLLLEQDAIEYEEGVDYFRKRCPLH
jgi:hypothetical protein